LIDFREGVAKEMFQILCGCIHTGIYPTTDIQPSPALS